MKATTVGEMVKTKIAKLGENINISRFVIFEVNGNGAIGHYIHAGAQIGVIAGSRTRSNPRKRRPRLSSKRWCAISPCRWRRRIRSL